jgi:hypothetical protein
MVVHYFNIFRASGRPTKANTELIVDPNTVLSSPISLEGLKSAAGRDAQIIEPASDL